MSRAIEPVTLVAPQAPLDAIDEPVLLVGVVTEAIARSTTQWPPHTPGPTRRELRKAFRPRRPRRRGLRQALAAREPRHLELSARARTLRRLGSWMSVVALGAAAAAIVAVLTSAYLVRGFTVPSPSMVPTLSVGDYLLVSVPGRDDIDRGAIVVFKDAGEWGTSEHVVKRVIGLPGDTVKIDAAGRLSVNGHDVVEPYLASLDSSGRPFVETVPDGQLWVMGDNRGVSSDSRAHGPVDASEVVGTVVLTFGDGIQAPSGQEAFDAVPPPRR